MIGYEDLNSVRQEPCFQQILTQIKKNSELCVEAPESRQFDFWIGKWDVLTPTGEMGGESVIEAIMGKCVVLERWKGATGAVSVTNYSQPKNLGNIRGRGAAFFANPVDLTLFAARQVCK